MAQGSHLCARARQRPRAARFRRAETPAVAGARGVVRAVCRWSWRSRGRDSVGRAATALGRGHQVCAGVVQGARRATSRGIECSGIE